MYLLFIIGGCVHNLRLLYFCYKQKCGDNTSVFVLHVNQYDIRTIDDPIPSVDVFNVHAIVDAKSIRWVSEKLSCRTVADFINEFLRSKILSKINLKLWSSSTSLQSQSDVLSIAQVTDQLNNLVPPLSQYFFAFVISYFQLMNVNRFFYVLQTF